MGKSVVTTLFGVLMLTLPSQANAKVLCDASAKKRIQSAISFAFDTKPPLVFLSEEARVNFQSQVAKSRAASGSVAGRADVFYQKLAAVTFQSIVFSQGATADLFGSLTPVFGENAQIAKWITEHGEADLTKPIAVCAIVTGEKRTFWGCGFARDRVAKFLATGPKLAGDKNVCDTFFRLADWQLYQALGHRQAAFGPNLSENRRRFGRWQMVNAALNTSLTL